MELVRQVQILNERHESICSTHPAMAKYLDRLGSFALVRQPVWEKENSEFMSI